LALRAAILGVQASTDPPSMRRGNVLISGLCQTFVASLRIFAWCRVIPDGAEWRFWPELATMWALMSLRK
jgi:hypothetical protein